VDRVTLTIIAHCHTQYNSMPLLCFLSLEMMSAVLVSAAVTVITSPKKPLSSVREMLESYRTQSSRACFVSKTLNRKSWL
jgi:hypothetical protein